MQRLLLLPVLHSTAIYHSQKMILLIPREKRERGVGALGSTLARIIRHIRPVSEHGSIEPGIEFGFRLRCTQPPQPAAAPAKMLLRHYEKRSALTAASMQDPLVGSLAAPRSSLLPSDLPSCMHSQITLSFHHQLQMSQRSMTHWLPTGLSSLRHNFLHQHCLQVICGKLPAPTPLSL